MWAHLHTAVPNKASDTCIAKALLLYVDMYLLDYSVYLEMNNLRLCNVEHITPVDAMKPSLLGAEHRSQSDVKKSPTEYRSNCDYATGLWMSNATCRNHSKSE